MSWSKLSKKIAKNFELISSGFHEAGHTIYALLHLSKIDYVSIFEDKKVKRILGFTSSTDLEDYDKIQDKELLEHLVKIEIGMNYAGFVAEKTLFKTISGSQQIPFFIREGSWVDNKTARELIIKYNLAPPGIKRAAFKNKIIKDVQKELYLHWDAVMIVAHGLFKYRKLSYQDLYNLLTKKSKNKKFWKDQFKQIDHYYDNYQSIDQNCLKNYAKSAIADKSIK